MAQSHIVRKAAILSLACIASVGIGIPAPIFAAGPLTGKCEDVFVPGVPEGFTLGAGHTEWAQIILRENSQEIIDDCKTRAGGIFAGKQVILADARNRLLNSGDKDAVPIIREYADKGVADPQFLLAFYYGTQQLAVSLSQEIPPLVTRAEVENYLRQAAEAGHIESQIELGRDLSDGKIVLQDRAESRMWLEKAFANAPDGELKGMAASALAFAFMDDPNASNAELSRMKELVNYVGGFARGRLNGLLLEVRGKRLGRGYQQDKEAALVQASDPALQVESPAFIAEEMRLLLDRNTPEDRSKVLQIIENAKVSRSPSYNEAVGKILYSGIPFGRDRMRSYGFLAGAGQNSFEAALRFADAIEGSAEKVDGTEKVLKRLYEAMELGVPGAGLALLKLRQNVQSGARDEREAIEIEKYLTPDGPMGARNRDVAHYILEQRAREGESNGYDSYGSKERIAAAISMAITEDPPVGHRIKGIALKYGKIYPQDDVASSDEFKLAAEAGDVPSMMFLKDAYARGIGVNEDHQKEFEWLNKAASHGSVDAIYSLSGYIPFSKGIEGFDIRKVVADNVVIYADRLTYSKSSGMTAAFGRDQSLGQIRVKNALLGLMDGFRLSLAARTESVILRIFKPGPLDGGLALPKETVLQVEQILHDEGFLAQEPDGSMGPNARAALVAWGRQNAITPPTVEPEPPVTDARLIDVPTLDPAILENLRTLANSVEQEKPGSSAFTKALKARAFLAQYGDIYQRQAVFLTYGASNETRKLVSPGLAAIYALDTVLSKPEGSEKAGIEFTFLYTGLVRSGSQSIVADVLLLTIRDDPRLHDEDKLSETLFQLNFVGGICEALGKNAALAKIDGIESDGCSQKSRNALLAWSKLQPPFKAEAAMRAEAAKELMALAAQ